MTTETAHSTAQARPARSVPLNTYGRWPWVAAAAALPSWAAAAGAGRWLTRDGRWVAGLALPILLSHQTEEWVRPGGFLPFANQGVLGSDRPDWPLTQREGFHINVTVGWASAIAGLLFWRRTAVPAVSVLWLEVGNVVLHTGLALRKRCYNPGVVTAAVLMAPHAIAAARWTQRSGRLSLETAVVAAVAGLGITALPMAMRIRMRHAADPPKPFPATTASTP